MEKNISDELKNKNGKVKAVYVRSDDGSDRHAQNPCIGKGGDRPGVSRAEGGRRSARDDRKSPNNERDRGRSHDRDVEHDRRHEDSLWCTASRTPNDDTADKTDHGGISSRSFINPEMLHRQRAEEIYIYGEGTYQALLQNRSDAAVCTWFVRSVTPRSKEALHWMAANHEAYHVVGEVELTEAFDTERHGGVCLLVKRRNGTTVKRRVGQAGVQGCMLALEGTANPHNLGDVIHSRAYFGVRGVMVQDATLLESSAAVHTAESGVGHVRPITGNSIVDVLDGFRQAGYTIAMAPSGKGKLLFTITLPEKIVLVLGREREALPEATHSANDLCIAVDSTGRVETFDVSVAIGVLLTE